MLNRSKVFKELASVSASLFVDPSQECAYAQIIWNALSQNDDVVHTIQETNWPFLVPRWQEKLNKIIQVSSSVSDYTVFSIDGSQVYPDRHQGVACYLINIGTALFRYGAASRVHFASEPVIKIGYEGNESVVQEVAPEIVNCQRTELELQTGFALSQRIRPGSVFLFDGSLIFWHLESKETPVRNRFLKSYLAIFEQMYQKHVLHAGYISLPKSRELVNIVRAVAELPELAKDLGVEHKGVEFNYVVDSDIAKFFLQPYQRTILFENRSGIVEYYPEHLRPYFFYLHNGTEIVRIEIPAWIARDELATEKIVQITLNQCVKGRGYPVCLAEAHEQAVVKGVDRDFFYHCLQKMALERGQRYHASQKSVQKRGIGI